MGGFQSSLFWHKASPVVILTFWPQFSNGEILNTIPCTHMLFNFSQDQCCVLWSRRRDQHHPARQAHEGVPEDSVHRCLHDVCRGREEDPQWGIRFLPFLQCSLLNLPVLQIQVKLTRCWKDIRDSNKHVHLLIMNSAIVAVSWILIWSLFQSGACCLLGRRLVFYRQSFRAYKNEMITAAVRHLSCSSLHRRWAQYHPQFSVYDVW